jgi:hypothetical protein
VAALAGLPRDIREKLVSWNHTQEYETAGYQDYAARLGGGQYEKIWDLGKSFVSCRENLCVGSRLVQ